MSSTAIAAATAGIAALGAVDWDDVQPAELPAIMQELERMRTRLDGVRLEVAGRLEETGAAAEQGWASTKDFLTAVSGGRKGAGGGLVRLAAGLRDLDGVRDGLADGWLSADKARVIAGRVAQLPRVDDVRRRAEELLLEKARDLDATDLDRAWPEVVQDLDPDGHLLGRELDLPLAERSAHHARYLAFSDDSFGGVRIRGYATSEEAELVKSVLLPLSAPVTGPPGGCGGKRLDFSRPGGGGAPCPDPECGHDGRDPREFGVRLWDALVELCGRAQTADVLPETHAAPPRLLVTVALDDLRAGARGSGTLPGGQHLSVEAVRRLACDAGVIPVVLGSRGQVLDVGRTRRLVTAAIWIALVARDRHCAFPGCRRLPSACDAHHIVHWADGGATCLDNLVLLCRHHHTVVHRTAWRLEIDPDTRRPVWHPPPRDHLGRITWIVPPDRAA